MHYIYPTLWSGFWVELLNVTTAIFVYRPTQWLRTAGLLYKFVIRIFVTEILLDEGLCTVLYVLSLHIGIYT